MPAITIAATILVGLVESATPPPTCSYEEVLGLQRQFRAFRLKQINSGQMERIPEILSDEGRGARRIQEGALAAACDHYRSLEVTYGINLGYRHVREAVECEHELLTERVTEIASLLEEAPETPVVTAEREHRARALRTLVESDPPKACEGYFALAADLLAP